jgi:hypothetical protein
MVYRFARSWPILIAFVSLTIEAARNAEGQTPTLCAPTVQLVRFLPETNEFLTYGTNLIISAVVAIAKEKPEPFNFTALLTVNNKKCNPFSITPHARCCLQRKAFLEGPNHGP